MSNALRRLIGTLLSSWIFQAYGLSIRPRSAPDGRQRRGTRPWHYDCRDAIICTFCRHQQMTVRHRARVAFMKAHLAIIALRRTFISTWAEKRSARCRCLFSCPQYKGTAGQILLQA
ncbi:hypothetical protein PVE_R2G0006 [Pseudomonas veronii 1YdBTEX2]|uniref:Uncharacterized protein n=1 Tax=Pseudomonas veronii 1YdBTEX2 TaxID=1295141 RepID=A0A1D3K713_PSEVE|nr:hypothetical protein PVE_R2G0006 [Pseudomonas veronii 1YdBTEX2]